MSKKQKLTIEVKGTQVTILQSPSGDLISLTDMLKAKDGEFFISDWLRNRNTVEFLGIWESVHNPAFNYGEFAIIRSQAGLNFALFGLTAREWRDANPKLDGNMRDHATIEQLLVLANIESMNAEFIHMALPQEIRLTRLNEIAIRQMKTLFPVNPRVLSDAEPKNLSQGKS